MAWSGLGSARDWAADVVARQQRDERELPSATARLARGSGLLEAVGSTSFATVGEGQDGFGPAEITWSEVSRVTEADGLLSPTRLGWWQSSLVASFSMVDGDDVSVSAPGGSRYVVQVGNDAVVSHLGWGFPLGVDEGSFETPATASGLIYGGPAVPVHVLGVAYGLPADLTVTVALTLLAAWSNS